MRHEMPRWRRLRALSDALLGVCLPKACVVCGRRLEERRQTVCAACYSAFSFISPGNLADNATERLFRLRLPVVRACSFLRYLPEGNERLLVLNLKYSHRPETGVQLGRFMAAALLPTGLFEGIDLIVPVPLSAERERKRGYNQSLMLARGIAEATGIGVAADVVARVVDNPSQTRLRTEERRENVKNIFALRDARRIARRHILLVDDLLTTGATLLSCGSELAKAEGVRLSILTLAQAGRHGYVRDGGMATP